MNQWSEIDSVPSRRGFYEVERTDGTEVIAEWTPASPKAAGGWTIYVSDNPTIEKAAKPLSGVKRFRKAERGAVEAALKRAPTVAERIDAAITDFRTRNRDPEERQDSPPAGRRLVIGDEIEQGAIGIRRTVVALADEGRIVVSSHLAPAKKNGPDQPMLSIDATHWTNCVRASSEERHARVHDSIASNIFTQGHLEHLLYRYQKGLDDNPTYQRGYAWSDGDKEAFLLAVFAGREVGRFVFVQRDWPGRDEILDGKQRLTCLWQFYTSQIACQGTYWHDLLVEDRRRILRRVVQSADLPATRYSPSDLLKIFLEVNSSGVPQTEAHLQKVRDQLAVELAREAGEDEEPVAAPAP